MAVEVEFSGVPARDAIDNIRQKIRVPSRRWDSLMRETHAKAFTVAGATKMDLLGDLHNSVIDAIEQGQSIGQFRQAFDGIVEKHGWSYKGNRGWRTRTIYDNNLRTAHMAGRWKQMQRTKARRPYLIYMTVADNRVRPEHARWHRYAVSIDNPFWDNWYPPNGWGCRCYVITASESQLKRMGVEVVDPPPVKRTRRVNTRTGEDYGLVPEGIDTGWDYNVGKAWIGTDVEFGRKLMQLPAPIRTQVLASNGPHVRELSKSWGNWLQTRAAETPAGYAHTVGYLPNKVINSLTASGAAPTSATLVAFDQQATQLAGAGRAIPTWLRTLPARLQDYQAVLRETKTGGLVFVLKGTTRAGRATVAFDIAPDGRPYNSVRAMKIMQEDELKEGKYELLDGEL